MKRIGCFILLFSMLFSVAVAEGVHIADFAERYYIRLKMLKDIANVEYELKNNSKYNNTARENNWKYFYLDELTYSIDENGIITDLSFRMDAPMGKQCSAASSLRSDTTYDELAISKGVITEDFFINYINKHVNKIVLTSMESAYPLGDYVVFVHNESLRFKLKSLYPSKWIQK